MLYIDKRTLDNGDNYINTRLNYPVLKSEDESYRDILKVINRIICDDINIFREICEVDEDILYEDEGLYNILTDYKISFNKEHIISISVEYEQLIGISSTGYMNTYNYDLNLEKEITIEDIFKKDIDYTEIIKEEIIRYLNDNKSFLEIDDIDDIRDFILIDSELKFSIYRKGICLCFSSYELTYDLPYSVEVPILFEEYENVLSEYVIENIFS